MIFCEYTSPIPGSALSWSLVAELISTKLDAAGGFVCAIMAWMTEGVAPNCAAAAPARRPNVSRMALCDMLLNFVVSMIVLLLLIANLGCSEMLHQPKPSASNPKSQPYMMCVDWPEEPERGGEIALRRSSSPLTIFSP